MAEYQGLQLYAAAVKKASSTELEKVLSAISGGIAVSAPSGDISLDPATNHCTVDMYLARAKGGKFNILQTYKGIRPSNPGEKCDLTKRPDTNQQFEPEL